MPSKIQDVDAKTEWVATGVNVRKQDRVRIIYKEGIWQSNPWKNHCGGDKYTASGCTDWKAAGNYLLPGRLEGCLVGKIGNGAAFYVGTGAVIYEGQEGELMLSINDATGGFGDNDGIIKVEITHP